VAVVLTLVHTKEIRKNKHKRNNTKNAVRITQNIVIPSKRITKTPTNYKTNT